ncbi:MAG: hypothetical protein JWP52_4119 [Rhizobacter sp.]|nr:hypothetical protein [Rhizobacter sp.]
MKAAMASGLEPLSIKTPQYNIKLANLNKTAYGKVQKFDTVPEKGHHRLEFTDSSTDWDVVYNIMITTTQKGCGNMMQRYSNNYYKSSPGRVMEISVFESLPGLNAVPLVSSTAEVCTNIAGRLRFHFEPAFQNTLPFNVLTFYKDGSLVAAHPMALNLEWLDLERMKVVEKRR